MSNQFKYLLSSLIRTYPHNTVSIRPLSVHNSVRSAFAHVRGGHPHADLDTADHGCCCVVINGEVQYQITRIPHYADNSISINAPCINAGDEKAQAVDRLHQREVRAVRRYFAQRGD